MKRSLLLIIMLALLLVSRQVPVFAQEFIIDSAGILTDGEKASLQSKMKDIASTYNFNLMIMTQKSIGGADPVDYSWNYLDSKDLSGTEWDGCLLLQATGSREYAITASGRGSDVLNNFAYDRLESKVVLYLKNDDYFGAYEAFIRMWEEYLVLEAKGRSYNFFSHYNTGLVIGSWVLAFLIGFFVLMRWKAGMNTVRPKNEADTYVVPESLSFTQKHDRFLYSTVTKTKREQSSASSGGSLRSG